MLIIMKTIKKLTLLALFFLSTSFFAQKKHQDTYTISKHGYNQSNGYLLSDVTFTINIRNHENSHNDGKKITFTYDVKGIINVKYNIEGYRYNGKNYYNDVNEIFAYASSFPPIEVDVVLTNGTRFNKKVTSNYSASNNLNFSNLKKLTKQHNISNINIKNARVLNARNENLEYKIEAFLNKKQKEESKKIEEQNNEENIESKTKRTYIRPDKINTETTSSNLPESIYEKRRKEAEAKYVKEEKQRLETNHKIRERELQTQRNIDKINKTHNQALNTVKTVIRNAFDTGKSKKQLEREWAEEDRRYEEEKRLREVEDREEERKAENRRYFSKIIESVNDKPYKYTNKKAFIIVVSNYYYELNEWQTAPGYDFIKIDFIQGENTDLPKEEDIESYLRNYKDDIQIYIKGPFFSKNEQETEYDYLLNLSKLKDIKLSSQFPEEITNLEISNYYYQKAKKSEGYSIRRNLDKSILFLGQTNSDIESLYAKSIKMDAPVDFLDDIQKHLNRYFQVANKNHLEYNNMVQLSEQIKKKKIINTEKKKDEVEMYGKIIHFALVKTPPMPNECKNQTELKKCFKEYISNYVTSNLPKYIDDLNPDRMRIYINFEITKYGSIRNIKIMAPDSTIKQKLNNILKEMPKMKPAFYLEEPVRVNYSLSLTLS